MKLSLLELHFWTQEMDHPPTNPPTHMQNLEMNRNATGVLLLLASTRKLSCQPWMVNDEAGWWLVGNTSTAGGEDTEICSNAPPLLVVHQHNLP